MGAWNYKCTTIIEHKNKYYYTVAMNVLTRLIMKYA